LSILILHSYKSFLIITKFMYLKANYMALGAVVGSWVYIFSNLMSDSFGPSTSFVFWVMLAIMMLKQICIES